MIEIKVNQVTNKLKGLFDRNMPTGVRCFSVLGGGNAGRIFIDDLAHPKMAYVWEQDDGTLYQGGQRDWRTVAEMVNLLRQTGTVALAYRDGSGDVENFPPDPHAGADNVEMDRPVRGSDLTPYLALPPGFEVHRMGRELLEKSPRLDETLFRYSSLDNYLETGMNVCIKRGDETVCEAGADMDVGGVREVGVVAERPYRGKGFGKIAVAHLLKWCDEIEVATYWDCVRLNISSLMIARKLGYTNERGYKLLAWFPPNREIGMVGSE